MFVIHVYACGLVHSQYSYSWVMAEELTKLSLSGLQRVSVTQVE